MGLIFKDANDQLPPNPKAARTRAILLSLPFAIVGIVALAFLLHDEIGSGFGMKKQMATGLLSVVVVCGGLIALIFGINAKKQALKAGSLKSGDGEKPWLQRGDWAAGRILSSSRRAILLLWIFVIFWNVISAVIAFVVVSQAVQSGNHAAFIALIFPVVGIAVLFYAAKTTLAWRRFGQSSFEMAAVPGALGGTLEGMIQVKGRLEPEHGLHLRLSCVRRATSGSGNNRSTTERILWQDEKWLRADLPQTDLNATGIPIYFRLPDNLPESNASRGDGIHWKLEASARLRGPDFDATFEVPVFKLAETPAPSDDPTAPFQMSLDDVRRLIHSRIQVNDLPGGGREFVFPSARNPGFATGATAIWLIWTGIIVLLLCKHAPLLFPLAFGAVDLLMTVFVVDLWFRYSRVVVTPERVQIETSWLGIKKRRTLEISGLANISAEVGATAGHSAYYDLKIRTRDRQDFTAAKNLGSKPEADWLVREMSTALKRPPA
ncbi:MAG: hypothetical protein WAO02_09320 [Verrucomicrobiia bacterium]